jgi:myo-inositol-1(or 4)-monophosphatase
MTQIGSRSSVDDIEIDRIAQQMADAARAVILPLFRSMDLRTDNKRAGGFDPVTEADRGAEAAMRQVIGIERPHDAILGEEHGPKVGTSGLTWILDPIDGTRGFMSGTPTWGVLIALSDENGPFYGLIDQPYIGERFVGDRQGARLTGPHGAGPIRTRAARTLNQATVFTTFPEVGSDKEQAAFRAVARRARLTRYGMDCYAYALVALGQVDLVIEAGLQAYDVQAPIAVIEAAGGIVTDWQGGPAHQGGQVIAAANREIHAEALAILQTALQ